VGTRRVHGVCQVQFGIDEGAVEVEDQQIHEESFQPSAISFQLNLILADC
jgi:hypothetical protein